MKAASAPCGSGAAWVWAQSVLMLGLVLAGPMDAGRWHHPAGVGIGTLLFLLGGVLGIVGVVQLGDNRTPLPRPRPGSRLIERGVYGWVRHPLYLSVVLAGFGWALLWQSPWTTGIAASLACFFDAKARHEEAWLRAAFPGYGEYARRVRRFIPGLY